MHPDVCRFVSEAFYEGRLDPIDECAERSTSLGVGIVIGERDRRLYDSFRPLLRF